MSQPSYGSCVHAINAQWPDISIHDSPLLHASYRNSKIQNILTVEEKYQIPEYAIGIEPLREWCFYYQKADLARQENNWEEVIRLGNEAEKGNYRPVDVIEWMPFLQADAIFGNVERVMHIASIINTHPFYRQQACQNMKTMGSLGYEFSKEVEDLIDEKFCKGK